MVTLSRTHPKLVRRLFELEVPEIGEGTVLIKALPARQAPAPRSPSGPATRMWTPSAYCIGTHNMRIDAILSELSGEKMDIVRFQ